jgi:hypothetical protein
MKIYVKKPGVSPLAIMAFFGGMLAFGPWEPFGYCKSEKSVL